MVNLFYVILLILTTLFWGVLFYRKDYHPQPLKVVAQSFLAGALSMIPVFTYQYLYRHFVPMLAEYQLFRPLLDWPLFIGLFAFVANVAALSLLLFILSGTVSLLLTVFSHSTLVNFKKALKDEPLGFVAVSLLLGMLIALQAWAQNWSGLPVLWTAFGAILFLAVIEEYIKHLMVRITDDKRLKGIDDAITLSIIVGLAFATIETLVYAFSAREAVLIAYRAMVSVPIHLVASGIFGYFYGLAHYAEPLVNADGGEKIYRTRWFHRLLTLKRSTVYREEKMIEGIFCATLFHAAMNTLFELNIGFLAVPCVALGLALLFRLYKTGHAEERLLKIGVPALK